MNQARHEKGAIASQGGRFKLRFKTEAPDTPLTRPLNVDQWSHVDSDAPEDARHAFTEGDCGHLAQELHKLTGWPVVTASAGDALNWYHAGVRTPDGNILDIEGVWGWEAWLDRWDFVNDSDDELEAVDHPDGLPADHLANPGRLHDANPEQWARELNDAYQAASGFAVPPSNGA